MKIRTYDVLAAFISLLGCALLLLSSVAWMLKIVLIGTIWLLSWWEWRRFRVRCLKWQDNKLWISEGSQVYVTQCQPSSIITRHLCFLYLSTIGGDKQWCLPVSRLELSQQDFRQLRRLAFKA